jgi:Transglycosylase SLT domain
MKWQAGLAGALASALVTCVVVSVASAKSPREIGNEARTALDAEVSNAVVRDMFSKVPADDDLSSSKQDHPSYLADYIYFEVPPDKKPADTVLESLKDIPIGTPQEEIKRAAEAFGVNVTFMEAIAKIESDFDPKQKTGSYVGLFQLSKDEFAKYGSGDILNVRDNAIAAAYKFATEAIVYQLRTHKGASFVDVYMIHQQGRAGAEEHLDHPERLAWESMCATDEGKAKGEKWCKRAIWDNTLPVTKKLAKSVDNLTSGEFVNMWRHQVDRAIFLARL